MKDYNFMISNDRLHKIRFCRKKGELTKTFLIKRGVGAKGLAKKRGVTFLRGGIHTLVSIMTSLATNYFTYAKKAHLMTFEQVEIA